MEIPLQFESHPSRRALPVPGANREYDWRFTGSSSTSMTLYTGSRQEQILTLLLNAADGMSIDELAAALDISRTAVKQHLAVLEKLQLVQEAALNSTGGRPARSYRLTVQGVNHFPKQYAWFGNLLLDEVAAELGSAGLEQLMRRMGEKLAASLLPQFAGKSADERMQGLLALMQELGYHAAALDESGQTGIRAVNCVYHDLAQKRPELCQFDLALIGTLLGRPVRQTACMAKQDCDCRFACGE